MCLKIKQSDFLKIGGFLPATNYLPHYVSRLMNVLNLQLMESLRPHLLTPQQFRVLQVLKACGTTAIGEIAADAVIEQSVVSRIVNRLARDGHVSRRKREGNGRIVDVNLTPKGHQLLSSLQPFADVIVKDAVGALTSAEQALLQDLLRRTFEHASRPHEPWARLRNVEATPPRAAKQQLRRQQQVE